MTPSDKDNTKAFEIVKTYLDLNHYSKPKPTHGFPHSYFADDLQEMIAKALCEARNG